MTSPLYSGESLVGHKPMSGIEVHHHVTCLHDNNVVVYILYDKLNLSSASSDYLAEASYGQCNFSLQYFAKVELKSVSESRHKFLD